MNIWTVRIDFYTWDAKVIRRHYSGVTFDTEESARTFVAMHYGQERCQELVKLWNATWYSLHVLEMAPVQGPLTSNVPAY